MEIIISIKKEKIVGWEPNNQIAYHEWYQEYVAWLESVAIKYFSNENK